MKDKMQGGPMMGTKSSMVTVPMDADASAAVGDKVMVTIEGTVSSMDGGSAVIETSSVSIMPAGDDYEMEESGMQSGYEEG